MFPLKTKGCDCASTNAEARYDGHADWYDKAFHYLSDEAGSAGLLGRLLGPPDPGDPTCLDIGCGTGLHFTAAQAHGYRVIGLDLSTDPLSIAATRNSTLICADAGRLPLRDACVPVVTMTFIHTDADDFRAVVAEAVRVLRPGGRLVCLGVHPAYVGFFFDRSREVEQQELRMLPGYGDERLQRDDSGRYPVRSRVGSRNLTLSTFLAAFLEQAGIRLCSVQELDTAMRPWQTAAGDGRVAPWNIAVTARAPR